MARTGARIRRGQAAGASDASKVYPNVKYDAPPDRGAAASIEVGLQYFGKRFLNPLLGRWVSADPLGVHDPVRPADERYGGQLTTDLNLYAYVRGQVLRAIDALGLQDVPPAYGRPSRPLTKKEERLRMKRIQEASTRRSRLRWLQSAAVLAVGVVVYAKTRRPGPLRAAWDKAPGRREAERFARRTGRRVKRLAKKASRKARRWIKPPKQAPSGRGVWDLGNQARGLEIERRLGGNLPKNFPTIDRWEGDTGTGISIKSVDLAAKTYQSESKLRSLLYKYINQLYDWRGSSRKNVRIEAEDIQRKVLHVAFSTDAPTEAQTRAINDAIEYAKGAGIEFRKDTIKR